MRDFSQGAQLERALDACWELGEYQRWLDAQPANSDYLFADATLRFGVQARDQLRTLAGTLSIPGVARATAERIAALIDGERTLAELRLIAGADRPALERIVEQGFGRVLFAPAALSALEVRVPGTELVRFVGSPYEIVRTYWENMADVRELALATEAELATDDSALRWLRRLHVVSLLGRKLDNFYRPPSRITNNGVRPGALYERATELLRTANATLILSGPRVGSGLLGGKHYAALLFAEDPAALADERAPLEYAGVAWGELVHAQSPEETSKNCWFLPPRPLDERHFQALFSAYRSALQHAHAGEQAETIGALARFNYRFVRLHPFRCANQSLCMNLVNSVLARALGAGIPHLLIDQLALRTTEAHYAELFRRAVRAHALPALSTSERWSALRAKKQESYALIERLQRAADLSEAASLVAANPGAASAALLVPSS